MNPLDKLKQKLLVKPTVEEREHVAVVIKGEKKLVKEKKTTVKKTKIQQPDNDETEIVEELEEEEPKRKTKIELVDERDKGYDRASLLEKLANNKLTKVTTKQILEVSDTKKLAEPISTIFPIQQIQKAKKLNKKKPLLLIEESDEEDEKQNNVQLLIESDNEKKEEVEEDNVEKKKLEAEPSEKKQRKTKKVEKGVAILGPETVVDIGDVNLSKRLPKKQPPVVIKASSYYMNNREIFINFINSLFEPYKREIESSSQNVTCETLDKEKNDFSLLTHQKIVKDYMNLFTPYRGLLLYHGLGSGKCMKKNTPIIMFDGSIKMVQDVKVGDFLMGDDSTPRKVTSLAKGKDKMYDVIYNFHKKVQNFFEKEKYTVNSEHILCLKASCFPKISYNNHTSNTNYNIQWIENNKFMSKTFTFNKTQNNREEIKNHAETFFTSIMNNPKTNDNVIEISVKDYLKLSNKKKRILKGYKVPVEFPEKELPIDPYIIGYWLGDNTSKDSTITSNNSTVLYYFDKNLQSYGLSLNLCQGNNYKISDNGTKKSNSFLTILKNLNIQNNKHIPLIYKCNSRINRLKLLAGLLDSNGYYGKRTFEFTETNETLMNDVIYLVRSLGFSCYKNQKNTISTYKSIKKQDTTWKINISGQGLEEIPTLIPRKKAELRKQIKDVLVRSITVKYVNEDDYYGFTLDGNCRYMIGDFTVTHNTCTSIALAEGMKDTKKIIIMTPASLNANYKDQLKFCGDSLYKRNQFWEFISLATNPEALQTISAILNLPQEYIRRNRGAWFVNIKKKSNYEDLSSVDKKSLDNQLDEMIRNKYTFINYNGLRTKRLEELTSGFTKNLFDNAVIVIDEAHNLISRIVNKLKKEKPILESDRGEKEHSPKYLSTKLYEYLMSATNARIVLLTGTPVINYPNEFGILFNILRGYIKTWLIPLNVKTSKKIDKNSLHEMLIGEKTLDFIDYSPSSKMLTITRNPFGFKNKVKVTTGYQGVTNVKKNESGNNIIDTEFISDDEFERRIIGILKRNDIEVLYDGIKIRNQKALPDSFDLFENQYIDSVTKKLKNVDGLKRRIIGLSSYFKSAQEGLLPKYDKIIGTDYHIVRIPMSDFQFKIYESARKEERKMEKNSKKPKPLDDLYKDATSTYKIFSRLYCNFVMEDRPLPMTVSNEVLNNEHILKEAQKEEQAQDVNDQNEGEKEGDEILDKIGGISYKERIEAKIQEIKENSNDYLTPEALTKYSPKYLHILENIKDPEYIGLHLIYSQFRTLEGIGLFSLVLEKNGFARFKIKRNSADIWEIDIPEEELGKPTYALYSGTETAEEKEIIRNIYNGDWKYIPTNISADLKKMARNNNMGEIIKVLMITSSGSEGINLKNTRFVHIMEPYWHPVRLEQVIGRARRICSHKDLPNALQTVNVFVYLMEFSAEQLISDDAIELKKQDLSKSTPHYPVTSDQLLYEISEIKANLTSQLTDIIKESAFDCYIYSNGKCMNFGEPTNTKFSYVPDYANQQSDITVQANRQVIEWEAKPITIGDVEYVYKRVSKSVLNIYDKTSYLEALNTIGVHPLLVGTLEINNKGQQVFKQLVT